jgi:hypothetical protein
MKLVNLTPHIINIADEAGNVFRTIPPTPPAARVSSESVVIGTIGGVPLTETIFGEVENLPELHCDIMYIVSQIVMSACPTRIDLVRPDTGPTCIRNTEGTIVAVRALTR